MIGFFYLVSLETSFSLWFFNLLTQAVRTAMTSLGIANTENLGIYGARDPILKYVGTGAFPRPGRHRTVGCSRTPEPHLEARDRRGRPRG